MEREAAEIEKSNVDKEMENEIRTITKPIN